MKHRSIRTSETAGLLAASLVFFIGAALFISSLIDDGNSFICSLPIFGKDDHTPTAVQLQAILHYATSRTSPQQSKDEIRLCFEVLKSRAPCNLLVFGLGHDSLMWASFNPRGTTLFLEENPKSVKKVLKDAPQLRAVPVSYRTQLKQADDLLTSYKSEAMCRSFSNGLRGNKRCRLALSNLPDEVYEREWDLIMIDGPQGWFAEAPGRMGVIFSAAVMARQRQGPGSTHVFLHDIDRKVEKAFAEEFLCRKYLVNAVGRLWHFVIPPAVDNNDTDNASREDCALNLSTDQPRYVHQKMLSSKMLKNQQNSSNCLRFSLMDLPIELLVEILLRLPVESLFCIRCVSKTLLNMINSPSFIRRHTLSLIAGNSHNVVQVPLLMCFAQTSDHGMKENSATLQSLRYDGGTLLTRGKYTFTHSTKSQYMVKLYNVQFVFHNLLCMARQDGRCLLINPLLREVMRLPSDDIIQHDIVWDGYYGMGFDNITNTYKVLRVSKTTLGTLARAHVLVLGTNSWREIPFVPPLPYYRNVYTVCAYGDMHWLVKRRSGITKSHIYSFDFKKEEFYWTPTPPTLQSSNKQSNLHLLTFRGSMAIVETFLSAQGGTTVELWMMKDYAKKEWVREYSINVDMHPDYELKNSTCGEWQHGIFFNDFTINLSPHGITRTFLDLRSSSVNFVICPVKGRNTKILMSYSASLISLKEFGSVLRDTNLLSAEALDWLISQTPLHLLQKMS